MIENIVNLSSTDVMSTTMNDNESRQVPVRLELPPSPTSYLPHGYSLVTFHGDKLLLHELLILIPVSMAEHRFQVDDSVDNNKPSTELVGGESQRPRAAMTCFDLVYHIFPVARCRSSLAPYSSRPNIRLNMILTTVNISLAHSSVVNKTHNRRHASLQLALTLWDTSWADSQ